LDFARSQLAEARKRQRRGIDNTDNIEEMNIA
jgi:hypothetical protein